LCELDTVSFRLTQRERLILETHLLVRDLKGVPLGRHQFFVLLSGHSPQTYRLPQAGFTLTSRKIGNRYGLVLGAQNKKVLKSSFNRLQFVPFDASDLSCAREFFTGKPSTLSTQFTYKSAQGKRVYPLKGRSEKELAKALLKAIDFFVVNEHNQPISYPPPWLGKNSNSWTNSILDVIPAHLPDSDGRKFGDFAGADAGHDVRINSMYFTRVCQPCKVQNPAYR
jgi:hypothetical protein